MNEKYLYILMRNDLPSMGPGRAAAQASHAANAFIHKFGHLPYVKQWSAETSQGFGTAIVLGVTFTDLNAKIKPLVENNYQYLGELITDPDYAISISSELVPFIDKNNLNTTLEPSLTDPNKYILHRKEITCGYIFGNKDDLKPLLGNLPLYS